jgi:adenylate cyclase class IV
MSLRRNIEFKSRLANFAAARAIAERVATDRLGVERQADTYFHVPHGRLKLREIGGLGAWLVGYVRDDRPDARGSDYRLVEITDATTLKETLTAALGVSVVVRKEREILLHKNVRIHLDQVEGLGAFLEFEAVLGPDDEDEANGHALLRWLIGVFADVLGDPISGSYSDLLIAAQGA